MEKLKVHPNGQWSLVKDSGKDPEFANQPDMDMMSYKPTSLEGKLPEDHGQKGVLHNNGSVRPPRQNSQAKMAGKVPNPIASAAHERSPGQV